MERELSLKMGQGRKWIRESVLKTMIDSRFIQGEVAQMVRAQDSYPPEADGSSTPSLLQ